jgi:2-polyprenyl-3-methyl-5-hydroxy-6-metoxy-1,4-benzoquinol methylase
MAEPGGEREEQLAYSQSMAAMLDEAKRRRKAAKLIAVLRHALGRDDLSGLRALDVGCSAGFIADELAAAGATTTGVDIDEPGLAVARERFGARVDFRLARGEDLPLDDGSVDVAVLNHIYEHVVDPEAGCSTWAWATSSGSWSRTTACRSCRGCRRPPPTGTCG